MHSRKFDAVIFDMGGVLISGLKVQSNKFEDKQELERDSIIKSIIKLGDNGVWSRWEKGEFAYDEFKEKFEEEYFQMNNKRILLTPSFQEWIPHSLIPQMIDKVKSLRIEGYKTALLTNNTFITPGNSFVPIDRNMFDVVTESCKLGIRKPSEKIFQICLDHLGVVAEKAIFLDDIGINLKAAKKMGITTIKVSDPDEAILEVGRILNEDIPRDTIPISSSHQLNLTNLVNYLKKKSFIDSDCDEYSLLIRKFWHGQSNPTYYLKVCGKDMVLRKKPPGKLLPSAHAIEREYSTMNSVIKFGVPVPKMIHLCEDSSVIGTPFYLMEYLGGSVYKDVSLSTKMSESRANIYQQVCEVLSTIHKISPTDLDIGIIGGKISSRREYLQRNINTWWKQYQLSKRSENSSMDSLHEWLLSNIPDDSLTNLPCTLCHGDFRLDNIIFLETNGRENLIGVIDWELATFGDPLTDLATFCIPYYVPEDLPFFNVLFPMKNFRTNTEKGIPTLKEFIDKYCTLMGIKESFNFQFYECFVLFRVASILTGVESRAQSGQNSGQNTEVMGMIAKNLSEYGLKLSKEKDGKSLSAESKGSSSTMALKVTDLRKEVQEMYAKIKSFINTDIIPAEKMVIEFYQNPSNINKVHPLMEEWKDYAKKERLWNLFLPIESDKSTKYGQGLTNVEYSFLCEEMGQSLLAPEVFNCSAPDTGNMEILTKYGTDQQKKDWLEPLLQGTIRSCFAMTEYGIASSDARNIKAEIKDGGNNEYVLNGHKWWTSGALHPQCQLCIFMGKTDPLAPDYLQQSMILIPMNSPGVKIIRPLHVFGFTDPPGGHAEITFTDVRVPKSNILLGEGKGFQIAQGRLGPGRVHHCMRLIGYAERSMELVMDRIMSRETFGKKLCDHGMIQQSIVSSKIEIEQARLLVMKTAHLLDQYGYKESKQEIAMIKVAVPNMAVKVLDRAIQCFGGAGFCEDFPLAMMYSVARILRVADGPDEVHIQAIATQMIKDYKVSKESKAQL